MARRRGQGPGVVEPHHRWSGLTTGLTCEADSLSVHDLLLLQLHRHLRRLCRKQEEKYSQTQEQESLDAQIICFAD